MTDNGEIFIKRQYRPDLRSPLTRDGGESALDGLAIVLPINYIPRAKDCSGDKSDKSDKKKEIGKDDKGARNASNAPGGPVTDISVRTGVDTPGSFKLSEAIDGAFFS